MSERQYRRIFKEGAGPPPWPCDDCGMPVTAEQLEVHHKDEDRKNHAFDNLGAMHHGCHNAHHRRGKQQRPEHVAKRSESNTGQKRTAEQRARISEAKKAQWAEGVYECLKK